MVAVCRRKPIVGRTFGETYCQSPPEEKGEKTLSA